MAGLFSVYGIAIVAILAITFIVTVWIVRPDLVRIISERGTLRIERYKKEGKSKRR